MFKKIDCVSLYVPDLDQAIAFYSDRIGLRLVWRSGEAAGLSMADSDGEIVLQSERKKVEVDILVSNADQAAHDFQQAGGSLVYGPFDIQMGRCAVVKDPWGNELVLLDMSKGRLVTDEQGNIIGNEAPPQV